MNIHRSGGSIWEFLCDRDQGLSAGPIRRRIKSVALVAHPDDETIGCAAILGRLPDPLMVYLTDGAPRDQRFWSADVSGSREEYAAVRRREAEAALKLVSIPVRRVLSLGAVDQDAALSLAQLAEQFSTVLDWFVPDIVITHAYEGGHPDHDTAALVARIAVELAHRANETELLEIPLYHAHAGECVKCEFLPGEPCPELTIQLTTEERARKQAMMACYSSQARVLQDFPLEKERLRRAPEYDFAKPPHAGKLWYECLQWPMTGKRWRELASRAPAQFHANVCG